MENIIEMIQRPGGGKGEARKLRADRRVPGICYGKHLDTPIPVSVDKIKIAAIFRKGKANDLYTVESGDASIKGQLVLVKDRQVDPLTEDLVHIDFQAINKDEPVTVDVAIELVGKSAGVAEGGILQQPNRTLEIKCLPTNIPAKIEADVTNVGLNESLHVSDIKLPEGVEVVGASDRTLAVVIPPAEEKVAADNVAADAVEVAGEAKAADAPAAEKKD